MEGTPLLLSRHGTTPTNEQATAAGADCDSDADSEILVRRNRRKPLPEAVKAEAAMNRCTGGGDEDDEGDVECGDATASSSAAARNATPREGRPKSHDEAPSTPAAAAAPGSSGGDSSTSGRKRRTRPCPCYWCRTSPSRARSPGSSDLKRKEGTPGSAIARRRRAAATELYFSAKGAAAVGRALLLRPVAALVAGGARLTL